MEDKLGIFTLLNSYLRKQNTGDFRKKISELAVSGINGTESKKAALKQILKLANNVIEEDPADITRELALGIWGEVNNSVTQWLQNCDFRAASSAQASANQSNIKSNEALQTLNGKRRISTRCGGTHSNCVGCSEDHVDPVRKRKQCTADGDALETSKRLPKLLVCPQQGVSMFLPPMEKRPYMDAPLGNICHNIPKLTSQFNLPGDLWIVPVPSDSNAAKVGTTTKTQKYDLKKMAANGEGSMSTRSITSIPLKSSNGVSEGIIGETRRSIHTEESTSVPHKSSLSASGGIIEETVERSIQTEENVSEPMALESAHDPSNARRKVSVDQSMQTEDGIFFQMTSVCGTSTEGIQESVDSSLEANAIDISLPVAGISEQRTMEDYAVSTNGCVEATGENINNMGIKDLQVHGSNTTGEEGRNVIEPTSNVLLGTASVNLTNTRDNEIIPEDTQSESEKYLDVVSSLCNQENFGTFPETSTNNMEFFELHPWNKIL